jgi:hypothetical protein
LDGAEGFPFAATQISSQAHRVESKILSNLVWDKSIEMNVFSLLIMMEIEEAKMLRRFKGTAVQTCSD